MARHARRRRLGVREFVGIVLLLAVVGPAWLWWQEVLVGDWQITSGSVSGCEIRDTHYNAPDYKPVVTLRYRYTVAGNEYQGTWQGLWPEAGSPNALPRTQLAQLNAPGRPLVVYYDPDHPADSSPHDHAPFRQIGYASMTVLGLCVASWYFVRVMPNVQRF